MSDPVLGLYLRDVEGKALLSAADEKRLARAYRRGDLAARDELITSNLRLVIKIAKRFVGCGLPLTDLIAEGNVGLFRAAEKFDPELGFRFTTYATWWINQAIKKALTSDTRLVRIPAYMRSLVLAYTEHAARLTDSLGRAPRPEEVAAAAGISPSRLEMVQAGLIASESLQAHGSVEGSEGGMGGGDERTARVDLLEAQGTQDATNVVDARETVARVLEHLSEREAQILTLRYGLDGGEPLTLQEVGIEVELTRERVRQIEREALARLRATPQLRPAG